MRLAEPELGDDEHGVIEQLASGAEPGGDIHHTSAVATTMWCALTGEEIDPGTTPATQTQLGLLRAVASLVKSAYDKQQD